MKKLAGVLWIVSICCLSSCNFINPLFSDEGSLAVNGVFMKEGLRKEGLADSGDADPLDEIDRIHCVISMDGIVEKAFDLEKETGGFGGSVKLKRGDYGIALHAYYGSTLVYSGSETGIVVKPLQSTSCTVDLYPSSFTLYTGINPEGTGEVTVRDDRNAYVFMEQVQLSANAASNYVFDHWGGALSGTDNPATLTITGNTYVAAYFVKGTASVTAPVKPAGPESGRVWTYLTYYAGGAVSNTGSEVEYKFYWGDGSYSAWGTPAQTHKYTATGTYLIKCQARIKTQIEVVSAWSEHLYVTITS